MSNSTSSVIAYQPVFGNGKQIDRRSKLHKVVQKLKRLIQIEHESKCWCAARQKGSRTTKAFWINK